MKRISLPVMKCDDGCGACCGPVTCKPVEYNAVIAYAAEHGIDPLAQGLTCPWYQGGKCTVYPVRPFVCQMFGHSPKLVCCKGYNRNVVPDVEERLYRDHKPRRDKIRFLHEVLGPGWQDVIMGKPSINIL
jgi:hypothetical protein